MLKPKLRRPRPVRMVAVYAFGQSLQTRPICHIPRDEAKWWKESGGASSHSHGDSIILSKLATTRLIGESARMGPNLILANANAEGWARAILAEWNPRPRPKRRDEGPRIDVGHYPMPEPATA